MQIQAINRLPTDGELLTAIVELPHPLCLHIGLITALVQPPNVPISEISKLCSYFEALNRPFNSWLLTIRKIGSITSRPIHRTFETAGRNAITMGVPKLERNWRDN